MRQYAEAVFAPVVYAYDRFHYEQDAREQECVGDVGPERVPGQGVEAVQFDISCFSGLHLSCHGTGRCRICRGKSTD